MGARIAAAAAAAGPTLEPFPALAPFPPRLGAGGGRHGAAQPATPRVRAPAGEALSGARAQPQR